MTIVDNSLTTRLIFDVIPHHVSKAAEEFILEQSRKLIIQVTRTNRGRGNHVTGRVTVPAWALDGNWSPRFHMHTGDEFAGYYLAHELAHVAARTHLHNRAFMKAFKRFCLPHLWHLEAFYKPGAARAAGISADPLVNMEVTHVR